MTDKVQKLLNEIATRKLCTMDEHMAFYNDKAKEDYRFLSEIEELIKALQEEPVSDELEKVVEEIVDPTVLNAYGVKEIANKLRMTMTEPVSEGLEEASKEWLSSQLDKSYSNYGEAKMMELTHFDGYAMLDAIDFGANWQKNHLWKPADGDDLPEYDKEVIAILDYDFGHYKVVYAHRPNPNGWNGTNIDTGEKEHFEPETYDNGGWNQPHILYWLDAKLPYEENKIDK